LHDPAVLAIGATVLVVVLCAGALWWGRSARAVEASPTASGGAAALAVIIAVALVHAVGSLTRLAIDYAAFYPWRYSDIQHARYEGLAPELRLLLPPHGGAVNGPVVPVDAVATFALAILFAVVTAVALKLLRTPRTAFPSSPCGVVRKVQIHDFVASLPQSIHFIVVTTVLLLPLIWALLYYPFNRPSGFVYALVVTLTHLLAFLALVVSLAGRLLPTLRHFMGTVADVSGFWPVVWHPMSGRSYRTDVVNAVTNLLRQGAWTKAALVGHSQGSVIAAWTLKNGGFATSKELHLVTCGSPLRTLYATFFPEHFDNAFFADVSKAVTVGESPPSWLNLWRLTDPIATPLPSSAAGVKDHCLDDTAGPVHGHGNYWTEQRLTSHVEAKLTGQPGREAPQPAPQA